MKKVEDVEILFVEDSIDDAKLAIRELMKSNIANTILHVDDGQAALDYIFCQGEYSYRKIGKYSEVDLAGPASSKKRWIRSIGSYPE